jgi:hypothetical protein
MMQLYDTTMHEDDTEIETLGINFVENSTCVSRFCVHICYFVPTCETETTVLDELTFPYSTEYYVCAKR